MTKLTVQFETMLCAANETPVAFGVVAVLCTLGCCRFRWGECRGIDSAFLIGGRFLGYWLHTPV